MPGMATRVLRAVLASKSLWNAAQALMQRMEGGISFVLAHSNDVSWVTHLRQAEA